MLNIDNYYRNFSILYVEDDDNTREGYVLLFSRVAKKLYVAKNGKEGLMFFKKYSPDIVITDSKMPLMDGFEMSQKIKEINENAQVIFMSADSDSEFMAKVKCNDIEHYLVKPIPRKKLLEAIENCMMKLNN